MREKHVILRGRRKDGTWIVPQTIAWTGNNRDGKYRTRIYFLADWSFASLTNGRLQSVHQGWITAAAQAQLASEGVALAKDQVLEAELRLYYRADYQGPETGGVRG